MPDCLFDYHVFRPAGPSRQAGYHFLSDVWDCFCCSMSTWSKLLALSRSFETMLPACCKHTFVVTASKPFSGTCLYINDINPGWP